jgi:hypothetical protein
LSEITSTPLNLFPGGVIEYTIDLWSLTQNAGCCIRFSGVILGFHCNAITGKEGKGYKLHAGNYVL